MHLALALLLAAADAPDVVFADFEAADHGTWRAAGTAFGPGPAAGALPNQMPVIGFAGKRFASSYHGGDRATGTLTSPEFTVERRYVGFLIGGGGFAGKTCLNLLVDGQVVRTAAGPNTAPGGSERLDPAGWDVAEFRGKAARLQVVDDAAGGWGHVSVDQIVFTDREPELPMVNPSRELTAEGPFLLVPVKNGGKVRRVRVEADGKPWREFDAELADGEPDWVAPLDVRPQAGRRLTVRVDRLPARSKALDSFRQGAAPADGLYRERLRPRLHFSPRRGWLNDPNGLAYYKGEYHLFFQHNPYGTKWGNMHWGHAVSRDLVRWEERDVALYPDAMGTMFSGSAVVDRDNTSGLGTKDDPPLALLYTAAGNPDTQCLAHTTDGRTFHKYAGNPVVKQITPGNRDPKVVWHAPTRKWVMALYVGRGEGRPNRKDTVVFLTSPDLKAWTPTGCVVEGFYECPDLFELPYRGGTKWVLTGASSEYMVGSFDGTTFTPETPKLPGHRGREFYAAQTFSDLPDGRRVQVGWLRAGSPGMPFNQCLSVPLELRLAETADGPRLAWSPVEELQALRGPSSIKSTLNAGAQFISRDFPGQPPLEVTAEFEAKPGSELSLRVYGLHVHYTAATGELKVNGHKAAAPPVGGKQRITVLADRTCSEVFASGGLTYVPMPLVVTPTDKGVWVQATGSDVQVDAVELRSIWDKQ